MAKPKLILPTAEPQVVLQLQEILRQIEMLSQRVAALEKG